METSTMIIASPTKILISSAGIRLHEESAGGRLPWITGGGRFPTFTKIYLARPTEIRYKFKYIKNRDNIVAV